jgi:cytochrome c oxidase assembly protein subunit 11
MPLLFFIDKDVLDDPTCQHVDDVVLSYTFFRSSAEALANLPPLGRARRNAHGTLEPDAAEDVVQKSMGFDQYEHAPKKEDRLV